MIDHITRDSNLYCILHELICESSPRSNNKVNAVKKIEKVTLPWLYMPVGNIRNRLLFIRCHTVIGNYGSQSL